jgi:hypothetical protein
LIISSSQWHLNHDSSHFAPCVPSYFTNAMMVETIMAPWQKTPPELSQSVNFDLNCPQIDSAERGGSHSSSRSSPPRKHAMNTEGKCPTGTNDYMASGGQGAQTTPKVQAASEKPTNTGQRKPRGKDPNTPSQTQRGSPRRQGNPKGSASGQDL